MKNMKRRLLLLLAVLIFLGFFPVAWHFSAEEAPRISMEEIKGMMGNPDLIVLDVRYGKDWDDSKEKIKGARREDPKKSTKGWADPYPKDKTIVLYCA